MIKNVVFDIGNVILKWHPAGVVAKLFPEKDALVLTQKLFKSQTWLDLNLGKMTELELIHIYHQTLGIDIQILIQLMQEIKESLLPIEHSIELLGYLQSRGYSLYALTDNVREIMSYLKLKYDFWNLFKGIVVSAEVGYLKPSPEIYQKLINGYDINPSESVFIDDLLTNVQGAQSQGLHGIQFLHPRQCIHDLTQLLGLGSIPLRFI